MALSIITRVSKFPTPLAMPPWIIAPNGGQVFYVASTNPQDGFNDDLMSGMHTTLGAALSECRANRGDTIIVLPGHVENVTATPTFVAGVRIIGVGNGDERPTFTWTATTSQWAVTVANVSIENVVLNLAGTAATSTTKAINWTGASGTIAGCRILAGAAGGAQVATIALELGTGADQFSFLDNDEFAPADAAVVSNIKIVAALKKVRILRNVMDVGMSATTAGLVSMTVAPVNIVIADNVLSNTITSSTKALVGITAATGYVQNNMLYITNATGGATAFGTPGSMGACQNFGCATNGSGLLTPAAGS